MPRPQPRLTALPILTAICALTALLTSCHPKNIVRQRDIPIMTATTDDTIHSYGIGLFRHNRFAYTISYGNQQPGAIREFYNGTWEYRSDTLFLCYNKKRPPGVATYLLKEITGGWWVQMFTDGRPRVFLRIWGKSRRPLF